jgi:hypothetical protein
MSYDVKFRQAALDYWENGHTQIETANTFSVSAYALQQWKNMLKKPVLLRRKYAIRRGRR